MTEQEKREKVICEFERFMQEYSRDIGYTNYDEEVLRGVLALLKSQEPRVMTLEEVTEDKPDVVWVDDRSYMQTFPAFVSSVSVWGWVSLQANKYSEFYKHRDNYGKKWRCWTSRPTDEQRRATEWQT